MLTLLDRYRNGDREQVWEDLLSLGAGVRAAEHQADALAVAQETMRRARHNCETIVRRLDTLGYKFRTREDSAAKSENQMQTMMAALSGLSNQFAAHESPGVRKMAAESRGIADNPMIRQLIDSMGKAASRKSAANPLENPEILAPPDKNAAKDIRKFEKAIGGPLPLSLRAWLEVAGSVSLMGTHEALSPADQPSGGMRMLLSQSLLGASAAGPAMEALRRAGVSVTTEIDQQATPLSDPLVVQPDLEIWDEEAGDAGPFRIVIAPDDLHKADISGDVYDMEAPNAAADAIFGDWHKTTFVNYLRIAFRWGGFPGWERYANRPEKELAFLAEGLLPI